MKRFFYSLFFFLAAAVIAGCGYTTRSALPSHLRHIYVEPFKNSINYSEENEVYFPLLEVKVRNAIVDRFLFDGNLRIADNAEDADLILKGELLSYSKEPLRYTDDDVVQEYRVWITINMILFDKHKSEPAWEENGFTGDATYYLTGAKAVSERTAVNNAVTDLAKRVVERTVEDW